MTTTRYSLIAFAIICLLSFAGSSRAQDIPNPGFENWTAGKPDGWFSALVTQSSDAHGGSSALSVAVQSAGGQTYSGALISGDNGKGFAYAGHPGALHGFYKFTQQGTDSAVVSVVLTMATPPNGGAGHFAAKATTSAYREFIANFAYVGAENSDTAIISAGIYPLTSLHAGTEFTLDDLSFGPAGSTSSVDDNGNVIPNAFELEQNFPNPFNPTTAILYDVPSRSHVKLTVFDQLGRVVETLLNETQDAGRYKTYFDATKLPSGVYSYTLQTDSFAKTRTMTLIK